MSLPTRLTVDDLAQARQDGDVLVIDVRTPAEFGTTHIPGSINVPVDTVVKNADELAPELHGDVVLVCRLGPRAERAEKALAAAGGRNLSVLVGGFEAWRDGGHDAEFGEAKWDMERQVRLVAGSIVLTGILASTVAPKAKWLSGAIGGGLVFSALSNTCGMANVLGRLPYNKAAQTPTMKDIRSRLAQ